MRNKVIIVTGPTATGKTSLGVQLAQYFNGEIISADSRQVYKGFDIGSGKDISEYSTINGNVPYHLIDIVEPTYSYNLMDFCRNANDTINKIYNNHKVPFIVGGTCLYLKALISGYTLPGPPPNEDLRQNLYKKTTSELEELCQKHGVDFYANKEEKNNKTRLIRAIEKGINLEQSLDITHIDVDFLVLAPYYHRKVVHQRIEERLTIRFENGMIEEVEKLHEKGLSWERLEYFGLEYRYIAQYLQKKLTLNELKDLLLIKIRQFAKRQDVWFRKMEREGLNIHWIKKGNFKESKNIVDLFLNDKDIPQPTIQLKNIKYS